MVVVVVGQGDGTAHVARDLVTALVVAIGVAPGAGGGVGFGESTVGTGGALGGVAEGVLASVLRLLLCYAKASAHSHFLLWILGRYIVMNVANPTVLLATKPRMIELLSKSL